ncbi:pseudouridine synthase [Crenobacter caeni]|uniref:Pseudouridine synthase n=1 Tax=Crenobacter caeni TaxID=2705474 RepID=A0A6B2KMF3_9NEIS|nr:16S rRNA pseudouridine(516) synthase [Crenobacter caeni]NDV11273.1 pseudouridine synthase [Crenobacter caeni]
MELYRFLHQQGFGSRKECRQLVEYGLVELSGSACDDWRLDVDPAALSGLVVDGEPWTPLTGPLYLLLNKPAGYETSHKPMHNPTVYGLLPWQFVNRGVSAVGRLDVDTTGLLLFSSDGQFVHALTSPKRHVPKCYLATVKHPLTDAQLNALRAGVYLKDDDERVVADEAVADDAHTLRLTISQGKYHQVKRMVAAAGNRVTALHRVSLGALRLDDLPEGQWRHLTGEELAALGVLC